MRKGRAYVFPIPRMVAWGNACNVSVLPTARAMAHYICICPDTGSTMDATPTAGRYNIEDQRAIIQLANAVEELFAKDPCCLCVRRLSLYVEEVAVGATKSKKLGRTQAR